MASPLDRTDPFATPGPTTGSGVDLARIEEADEAPRAATSAAQAAPASSSTPDRRWPHRPAPSPAAAPTPSAPAAGPGAGQQGGSPAPKGAAASGGQRNGSGRRNRGDTGMASDGAPVRALPAPPAPPVWPSATSEDDMYIPDAEVDFVELSEINRMLNRCRARMFRTSAALKSAQRSYQEAQIAYDRAMRRHMVSLSGGTEASRRALAEILCEDLENEVVVMRQVVEECKKRSLDVRDDLKAVENLAHNARAQMAVM